MKRRELIKSLAMTALGGGACIIGAASASAAESSASTTSDGLAVGQSIRVDNGLKLTFVAVRNDSRCPMGAFCITAGDATVVLEAHLPNQPVRIYKLHTNEKPRSVSIPANPPGTVGFKVYSVKLVLLTPRPRIGSTLKQSDYRLTLAIDVAY